MYMYNNSKSETIFSYGVPQRSILGPLFFKGYMKDFFRASNFLFSIFFVDDTIVLIKGQTYNNIIFTLNTEIQKLDMWLQAKIN